MDDENYIVESEIEKICENIRSALRLLKRRHSPMSSHHPSCTQESSELAREVGSVHPEAQEEALLGERPPLKVRRGPGQRWKHELCASKQPIPTLTPGHTPVFLTPVT